MKKMKDKLNETMEYYKGSPKGTYCEVLDEMKKTQVNGWYTSSLPLAEFWQPANLPRINSVLAQHLPELDIEHARKRFEFPTNPCMGIGYQFLHRTASACYKTNESDGQKPVLLYQLFYKAGDDAHIQKMEAFKEQLREWARLLRLRKMKFLILSVPITNADEVERRYGHLVKRENARIFEDMKLETIYRFDFDSIEVEDVLAGKEE